MLMRIFAATFVTGVVLVAIASLAPSGLDGLALDMVGGLGLCLMAAPPILALWAVAARAFLAALRRALPDMDEDFEAVARTTMLPGVQRWADVHGIATEGEAFRVLLSWKALPVFVVDQALVDIEGPSGGWEKETLWATMSPRLRRRALRNLSYHLKDAMTRRFGPLRGRLAAILPPGEMLVEMPARSREEAFTTMARARVHDT